MKKQKQVVLHLAIATVLLMSGAANAAWSDADASGAWSGNLEFNGTITNTSPIWKYQIPDEAVTGAKNLDIDRSVGRVESGRTIFEYSKEFHVFEGVMKTVAPKGGAGLQPIIQFGVEAKPWNTAENGQIQNAIVLLARDSQSGETVGDLSIQLNGGAVSAWIDGASQTPDMAQARGTVFEDAAAVLTAQPWYKSAYSGAVQGFHDYRGTSNLGQPTLTNVSGAVSVSASAISLSVPSNAIPNTWVSTLPISVTVQ